jgi:6-pyruvoyl-tetrahydropterin synthase
MTDIVERMKDAACPANTGCMSVKTCVCDIMGDASEEIESLRDQLDHTLLMLKETQEGWEVLMEENAKFMKERDEARLEAERLNKALKWEQDRSGRVGTHSPGCWKWGHQHYGCAVEHIAGLDKELESAALIVGLVREDLKDNQDILDEAVKEVNELNEEVRRLRVEAGYD